MKVRWLHRALKFVASDAVWDRWLLWRSDREPSPLPEDPSVRYRYTLTGAPPDIPW